MKLSTKTKSLAFSLLAVLSGTLVTEPCRANGFLIYDLSAEAIGKASAVSADVSEPSAVWFNPAALAFLDGSSVSATALFLTARSSFKLADGGGETSSDRGNFVIPALFGHAKLTDRVALGMGVYSAFGIGLTWPRSWAGRENAISASLRTVAFNPTVALRLSRAWSVAAGFDALRSTVDFQNALPEIVGGEVRLVGGTWGFGFNAAALYRAIPEQLHLALTYRSRVKLNYSGRADFQPRNADFERSLPDQSGRAEITLPDIVTAGVMVRPRPNLTLGLDLNTVLWSTYKRIDIDFAEAPDRTLQPDGRTSFMLRAGVDYLTPEPGFHVRGGVIFDRRATPPEGVGPALPESDRLDLAMGLGYERDFWRADLGYIFVIFLPAQAKGGQESPEGTYRTLAQLMGLTVRVRF